jgi:eukaryotic-like serine/threonine-protein kinase
MARAPTNSANLIADRYAIDVARPLAPLEGATCFAATDRNSTRDDLVAVQVRRNFPVRARALQALAVPIEGLVTPIAHGHTATPGPGETGYVIYQAPPGPSLAANRRHWSEAELLEHVVRPVSHVLEQLQARGITHRGIRLDNMFQSAPGQPVTVGPAWSAPPALAQPAIYEPPYSAMCLPAARGDGNIADDVYALGVVLLCLATGHVPLAGVDDASVVYRKLEFGSFAALTGSDARLSPAIADLTRGMLAEDPEHRPPPSLLTDPAAARGRRVAARPPRLAQRPITLAGLQARGARSLAYAIARAPDEGVIALRDGSIVSWLRRGVGDALLASHVDELVRHRGGEALGDVTQRDALLLMRAIALLDPLAPMFWQGIALWPDGIGTALASAQDGETRSEVGARIDDMIRAELAGYWAAERAERTDVGMNRVEARRHRAWLQDGQQDGGSTRLSYLLNPLLPCQSPLLRGHWVSRLPELLPALETISAQVDRKRVPPVDAHIAAFIAARSERRLDNELNALTTNPQGQAAWFARLRLLADVQVRYSTQTAPGVAAWLAEQAEPALAVWHNRERRTGMAERMRTLAATGALLPMLALVEDPAGRSADVRDALAAAAEISRIDAELAQLMAGGEQRAASGARLGQEIAAGIGLAGLAIALAVAAL